MDPFAPSCPIALVRENAEHGGPLVATEARRHRRYHISVMRLLALCENVARRQLLEPHHHRADPYAVLRCRASRLLACAELS